MPTWAIAVKLDFPLTLAPIRVVGNGYKQFLGPISIFIVEPLIFVVSLMLPTNIICSESTSDPLRCFWNLELVLERSDNFTEKKNKYCRNYSSTHLQKM